MFLVLFLFGNSLFCIFFRLDVFYGKELQIYNKNSRKFFRFSHQIAVSILYFLSMLTTGFSYFYYLQYDTTGLHGNDIHFNMVY
jgi:hypothetical protein